MTALIIAGAILLFVAPVAVLAWALCRIAALSDEAARRLTDQRTSTTTTRLRSTR